MITPVVRARTAGGADRTGWYMRYIRRARTTVAVPKTRIPSSICDFLYELMKNKPVAYQNNDNPSPAGPDNELGRSPEEEIAALRAELAAVKEALGRTEQQLQEARRELAGDRVDASGTGVSSPPSSKEKLFSVLTDTMPVMVFRGNREAECTDVFGSVLQSLGWSRSDVIGKKLVDLFPQAEQTLADVMATGRLHSCRVRVDGDSAWCFDMVLLPDAEIPGGVIGCARDISTYTQTEQELKNLTVVLEESLDFIAVTDLQGQALYLNRVFREAVGTSSASVNVFALMQGEPALLEQTILPQVLQTGSWSGEMTLVIGDTTIPVLQQLIVHRNEQDAPLFFSTVIRNITRRKEALEALRIVEERWKFAFDGAGDGVWDWNIETSKVFFSPRWKEMLGYGEHEIGDTLEEWVSRLHPDHLGPTMQELEEHFQGENTTYESEQLLRCRDGSYKWILDRGKVVAWAPDGRPLRMVGTSADITGRKQAEEQLRRSESRFRTMSDASPLGIFVTSPAGACEYTNAAYHRISGLEFGQTLGNGWSAAIHPDDREQVLDAWLSAISNRESFERLIRYHRPDADVVWVSVKAEAMWDGESLLGYVGTVEDITSRKAAEEELQQREEFLRETSRIASVGGWEMDLETYKITWSEQMFHIHEMPVGTSPDIDTALSFYSDKTRSFLMELLKKTAATGESQDVEVPFITARGNHHWARIIGNVQFRDGQPARVTGTFQDITDRKMAEEVIRYKNQMLNGILASMPVVAYRIDRRNRFSEIRGSALRRFGADGENLIGQPAPEFFQQILPDIERARRGDIASTEYRGEINDSLWCMQNYLFPDMFHEGHLIGFALDITERVAAEEELHRSRAKLAAVFDSTTDSIWAIDRDYRLIAYNTSFADYTRDINNIDVSVGMEFDTLVHREHQPQWKELYDRALAGENFSIESALAVQDEILYFDINFNPVTDDGRIIGAVMFSKNVTERRKTEEILKEKLATLKAVLESTDSSIFALDTRYCYLTFNSRHQAVMKHLYGVDIRPGDNVPELMRQGSDEAKMTRHLNRAIYEGPFTVVEEFGLNDQSQIYMELSYNPIQTDTGEVIGIAVYAQDITERRNAEDELRRTLVLKQAIMDAADVSIISSDIDGTIVTFNRAAERMLGYRAEEVTGKTNPSILHDPDEVQRRARELTKELGISVEPGFNAFVAKARLGRTDENEWTYIRKDGSRFPVLLSVTALRDNDNNLTGFLGIGVDITERKQAEQLLLKTQDDLLEAQRIAQVGSFEIDVATRRGVWTKQAALIYGLYENAPMIGDELWLGIHPDDVDTTTAVWQSAMEQGTVINHDYRIIRPDGDVAFINVFGRPVLDEQGQVVLIKGTLQDITERKKHERELIAARDAANSANRAKSEFLANMSHEIRTPMNSVLGFTELLRNLVKDEQQMAYLQAITTSGKMLLRLINDILDLSKVEAGRLDFRYELEDIGLLAEETRQIFAIRVQEKGLDFFIDNGVRLPFVLDAARLRQILLNLVGNAVKFTDRGYVRLTLRMENNDQGIRTLRIAVEDSGIGIPDGQQALIFEAFRQQDGQSTRRYGGTGLGLTITKRLVEAMNGKITVRSTAGRGSVFEIVLPEAVPSFGSVPTDTDNDAIIDFETSVVMVVDDNDLNRELVREMLQGTKLQLLEASTGTEAVKLAGEHRPDMILMDLHLPDINGDVATDRIRALAGMERVPVIFLTASAIKEDAPVGTTLARETYLYKPVGKKELVRTLALFLPHSTEAGIAYAAGAEPAAREDAATQDASIEVQDIPAGLIDELNNRYMPLWRELNEAPILYEVEQFAEGLCNLGEHYHIAAVQRYGELLHEQVQMVNVVDFPVTLARFPALVHSIEKMAQK